MRAKPQGKEILEKGEGPEKLRGELNGLFLKEIGNRRVRVGFYTPWILSKF